MGNSSYFPGKNYLWQQWWYSENSALRIVKRRPQKPESQLWWPSLYGPQLMETAGISTQTKNIRIFEIELQSLKMPRYKRTKRLISYRFKDFYLYFLHYVLLRWQIIYPTPLHIICLTSPPSLSLCIWLVPVLSGEGGMEGRRIQSSLLPIIPRLLRNDLGRVFISENYDLLKPPKEELRLLMVTSQQHNCFHIVIRLYL